MIKKLMENHVEFLQNHNVNETGCGEFVKFVADNDMDLYFCKLPAIVLPLFDVIANKLTVGVPFVAKVMKFPSLKDFKKYFNHNKDKYFIIYKSWLATTISYNVDFVGNTVYVIRYMEIQKQKYKLVNIKCELNAL